MVKIMNSHWLFGIRGVTINRLIFAAYGRSDHCLFAASLMVFGHAAHCVDSGEKAKIKEEKQKSEPVPPVVDIGVVRGLESERKYSKKRSLRHLVAASLEIIKDENDLSMLSEPLNQIKLMLAMDAGEKEAGAATKKKRGRPRKEK
jgi:hypothetical protein